MQTEYAKPAYANSAINIHNADALKFNFTSLGDNLRVTGNLPYNISTPILFHLLDNVSAITDMHFMLQKEVVERMVAAPGTADYGRLSVMLQYRFAMEYLFIDTGLLAEDVARQLASPINDIHDSDRRQSLTSH